jgi:DNA-binding beta-propeller fold protein YncE
VVTKRQFIFILLTAALLVIENVGESVGRGFGHSEIGAFSTEQHFLYVATPGIRNYVEYGGIGLIVYDMDRGHRFVKRTPTFDIAPGAAPENVKGIAAHGRTGRVYISTPKRVGAFDIATGARIWVQEYEGGADRIALSPDGKTIYVPSFEGPHWHAVDATDGKVVKKLLLNSGAHNTLYGPDGRRVYLAGLKSPILSIADARTHEVVGGVGPFSSSVRPFTINASQTLCFVNVNDLLGFEIGDIKTRKMLHRVTVTGHEKGPVKRHGCPSHGIALRPDEKELWLADAANSKVHVFDLSVMPPKQIASLPVRDQPGWITFSMDGRYGYPSTGEVIDTATKQTVATLADEAGNPVQSEKMVEVVFSDGKPSVAGDQFGIGRRR